MRERASAKEKEGERVKDTQVCVRARESKRESERARERVKEKNRETENAREREMTR